MDGKSDHQLCVYMVNQRADEVFGLIHRVVLCILRFLTVSWYLHVPRVIVAQIALDGFAEHCRGQGADVLQRVLSLLRL